MCSADPATHTLRLILKADTQYRIDSVSQSNV